MSDNSLVRITPITEEESEKYRQLPYGVKQTKDTIRNVMECGELRHVLEVTANGWNLVQVKVDDPRQIVSRGG